MKVLPTLAYIGLILWYNINHSKCDLIIEPSDMPVMPRGAQGIIAITAS